MNSLGRQNSQSSAKALGLFSRKIGETGPDFVVLHGLFGSGKNWRTFAGSLEENLQVWTPVARNHGDSPHSDLISYHEKAEDVVLFFVFERVALIFLLAALTVSVCSTAGFSS